MAVQLTIVTPEGEALSQSVDSVVLPGSEGDFGVLAGHERFLSALRIGPLAVRSGSTTQGAAVSKGFADVGAEDVVVLVDRCQLADQIDKVSVEAGLAEAEAELRELSADPANDERRRELEETVERAGVWIEVAGKS